jgi:hypothetical protein
MMLVWRKYVVEPYVRIRPTRERTSSSEQDAYQPEMAGSLAIGTNSSDFKCAGAVSMVLLHPLGVSSNIRGSAGSSQLLFMANSNASDQEACSLIQSLPAQRTWLSTPLRVSTKERLLSKYMTLGLSFAPSHAGDILGLGESAPIFKEAKAYDLL